MKNFCSTICLCLLSLILILSCHSGMVAGIPGPDGNIRYSRQSRVMDSVSASRIKPLPFPPQYRNRALPAVVDNSANPHWPGIQEQYNFFSCQQHAGVAYTYSYEVNRLKNRPGTVWQNNFSPYYTWNFMNEGDRFTGANFIQSFEVLKVQGQMTNQDYGFDSLYSYLGWVNGYEKYFRGMSERLKDVYAIQINSSEGIDQVRNYLFDHLDGSPAGGVVCFTTSSATFYSMKVLSPGTPEEGKNIILQWQPDPVHGLAIVGYNDSIRYDINNDGQYTTGLDINGDGIVNACDREIGAFKLANSYGSDWSQEGYVYALYSSFARDFPYGGIWNNSVYVVEPDTNYSPSLTLKVDLSHNLRKRIRVMAGVNQDTSAQFPQYTLDFPIFHFQGGDFPMQGNVPGPGGRRIEFGLDVTPLLNMTEQGKPARYFLLIEEDDPDKLGEGTLHQAFFIDCRKNLSFPAFPANEPIIDQGITTASVVMNISRPLVQITTATLPPAGSLQPFEVQLQASGGEPPYHWELEQTYSRRFADLPHPALSGPSIRQHNDYKFFETVRLPFKFPFYGKEYDTIYINHYGFVSFTPDFLPSPYITDELNMLESFPVIVPAFSQKYTYMTNIGDGIWLSVSEQVVSIRWRISVAPYYTTSPNDFALLLYPDGRFAFRYGEIDNQGFTQKAFSGVSAGDGTNHQLVVQWDANELSGRSEIYIPAALPPQVQLSPEGLLQVDETTQGMSYDLNLLVQDANRIAGRRTLEINHGLSMALIPVDSLLERMKPALFDLRIVNRSGTTLSGLQFRIRCNDTLFQITDSTATLAAIAAGQSVTLPSAFSVVPGGRTGNGYPWIPLLTATTGSSEFRKQFVFTVSAPEISIAPPVIRDGDDNLLSPGEVADLIIPVRNSGWRPAEDLVLKVWSTDESLEILSDSEQELGELPPAREHDFTVRLKASKSVQPGIFDTLEIQLYDAEGVIRAEKIRLMLGKRPVAIVNMAASSVSPASMAAALDSLGIPYDTLHTLNFDHNRYSSVFLILGHTLMGSHTVSINEATLLAGYLQKNGKLYMEGYYTWYYLNKTPLHPLFRYTSEKVSAWFFPEVYGVSQTFTDSMSFDYGAAVDYAIFSFEPKDSAFASLVNSDIPGRATEIAYDGEDYKTIGSLLEFGYLSGMDNGPGKTDLMRAYLEFFGLNISGPHPYFHSDVSEVCTGGKVSFTDDSFDGVTSWQWEFEGGTPAVSAERNPVVSYSLPGIYPVKLTVSDGKHTHALTRKEYVTVTSCSGISEGDQSDGILIYPNPARDKVTIRFTGHQVAPAAIILKDLSGRILQRHVIIPGQSGPLSIDLSKFEKGFYLFEFRTGTRVVSKKIILH